MKFSTGLEMLGHTDRWLKPAAAAKGKEARCTDNKATVGKTACLWETVLGSQASGGDGRTGDRSQRAP